MPGAYWVKEEIESLYQQLAQGLAPSEIDLPGRSSIAIGGKARRIGFIGDGLLRRVWTEQELALLESLQAQGFGPAAIVQCQALPGRSRDAIAQQLSRQGLVDQVLSCRVRHARPLPEEVQQNFHAFLRCHWQTCTPEQLAHMWCRNFPDWPVTHRQVVHQLTQLKIKLPRREVMRLPYSKAKQRRVSPRAMMAARQRWQRYWQRRAQELRDLARQNKEIQRRQCRCCGRRWPACRPFFSISNQAYIGRICALCQTPRYRKAAIRDSNSSA